MEQMETPQKNNPHHIDNIIIAAGITQLELRLYRLKNSSVMRRGLIVIFSINNYRFYHKSMTTIIFWHYTPSILDLVSDH